MANAARHEPDERLARTRLAELDVLHDERLSELLENGGADLHPPIVSSSVSAHLERLADEGRVRVGERGVGPRVSRTVNVRLSFLSTPVMIRVPPPAPTDRTSVPFARVRWKLSTFDWSLTTSVYVPAGSLATFRPFEVSWKRSLIPGPSCPMTGTSLSVAVRVAEGAAFVWEVTIPDPTTTAAMRASLNVVPSPGRSHSTT